MLFLRSPNLLMQGLFGLGVLGHLRLQFRPELHDLFVFGVAVLVPEANSILPIPGFEQDEVEGAPSFVPPATPGPLRVRLTVFVVPADVVRQSHQILHGGTSEDVLSPADVFLCQAQPVSLDLGHQLGGRLDAVVLTHRLCLLKSAQRQRW